MSHLHVTMFRFAFLLFILPSTLCKLLFATDPYDVADTTCSDFVLSNKETQDQCNEMLMKLGENCVKEGHTITKINKASHFRSQVVCDFLGGSGIAQLSLNAQQPLDVPQYLETEKMKQKVDSDIKYKLNLLASVEIVDELESIARESNATISKTEEWLKKKEQSYLLKLAHMIKEMSGKESMFTTPTPPTTSYQPLPSVVLDVSHHRPIITGAQTHTPQFIGTEVYGKKEETQWRCAAQFWGSYNARESFVLLQKKNYWMDLYSRKEDYEAIQIQFGDGRDSSDSSVTFVLVVGFQLCYSYLWRWVVYSGIQFHHQENGWLTMSYKEVDRYDVTLVDPLAGDGSESQVVVISALGSSAKPTDCTNDILGPGIYRRYSNGTCKGIPMFSKRAANVESACTDQMWEGANLVNMWVSLLEESWYNKCLQTTYATTPHNTPSFFFLQIEEEGYSKHAKDVKDVKDVIKN